MPAQQPVPRHDESLKETSARPGGGTPEPPSRGEGSGMEGGGPTVWWHRGDETKRDTSRQEET